MTPGSETALTAIFFVTSVATVVTGSTSLITIPVMLQFGMEPRTAVATNMLALGMLSLGGVVPFLGTSVIDRHRAPWLIALTLAGSIAGALLLFAVPAKWMALIVPLAMISVLVLLLLQPEPDASQEGLPSTRRAGGGYAAMAALSIYGGFLSGGYSTILTAAGVVLFRYPWLRAIAMSRLLNTASSMVAVTIFAWYGIIDWRLGIVLSVAAFGGGLLGSHWARKMPAALLRRVFLFTVTILAIKALVFDVPWREL